MKKMNNKKSKKIILTTTEDFFKNIFSADILCKIQEEIYKSWLSEPQENNETIQ